MTSADLRKGLIKTMNWRHDISVTTENASTTQEMFPTNLSLVLGAVHDTTASHSDQIYYIRETGFFEYSDDYLTNIHSTIVLLAIIFVFPFSLFGFWILWLAYLKMCNKLDSFSCYECITGAPRKLPESDASVELKNECCKKSVAPILFPLPPDYDFKRSCGYGCKRRLEGPPPPTLLFSPSRLRLNDPSRQRPRERRSSMRESVRTRVQEGNVSRDLGRKSSGYRSKSATFVRFIDI